MSDQTDSLVLEYLRAIRETQTAHGDRLNRIEGRLAGIEHTLGHVYATAGDDRAAMDALARRIERIERRLELSS